MASETVKSGVHRKTGIPREILKWLQSLDLTYSIKNVRRDFSNGYLLAEIFSWYYPSDIHMHSYDNGTSLPTKLGNWSQLERFFLRKKLGVPKELIDGAIHCKQGAAELLVQTIYTMLTNRVARSLADNQEIDFTDGDYQRRLPMHARSTASHAIKNNLKITEFMTDPNIITNRRKAHAIISRHLEYRTQERHADPGRFNIKPSIGQLALRVSSTSPAADEKKSNSKVGSLSSGKTSETHYGQSHRLGSVQFREVQVQQMNKSSQMSMRPGTIHTVQTPVFTR